ncbi:thioredoxin family protein [Flavobacterium olei]|uniref:thioredoxin family protein n=1 Tax=Flavobacterium olei TaxID=1886782 RepID=UPI00321B1236
MKKLSLLILLFGITSMGFSQLKSIAFEEIENLQKIQQRKVVVFIHTDWCQFCQRMKSATFKNQEIIQQLNDDFYFIDFNAEEKRDISFQNKTFQFNPTGIMLEFTSWLYSWEPSINKLHIRFCVSSMRRMKLFFSTIII